MIADAIDTVITLGWAFVGWLALISIAAALALHTVIAAVWWTARALWRGLGGPSWGRSRIASRRIARATRDYEEAA
ncbi:MULTISPECIES: hypothetical protein [unclassified Streptomyces]|uniref:hypothetical protein n=1 Tax=unclassified Streptomyces TaxID=2593676 RepID=UPI0033A2D9D3